MLRTTQVMWKLAGGKYALRRSIDGAGDSGPMLLAVTYDSETSPPRIEYNVLRLGACVRVGSINGRSYSAQDWWQTTPVTEVLRTEQRKGGLYSLIEFKTASGKIYTLEVI